MSVAGWESISGKGQVSPYMMEATSWEARRKNERNNGRKEKKIDLEGLVSDVMNKRGLYVARSFLRCFFPYGTPSGSFP
jgi:hypothetical protein